MSRHNGATAFALFFFCLAPVTHAQFVQQAKLVGSGTIGGGVQQGTSVALSSDGNTALIGGPFDNAGAGAVWVMSRANQTWNQTGKIVNPSGVGTGNSHALVGYSVSISADANTLLIAGLGGSVAGILNQSTGQSSSLSTSNGQVPVVVALSADGNTAAIGNGADPGSGSTSGAGAVWIFVQSNGSWVQQGSKLVPPADSIGFPLFGKSLSLSSDGNTLLVGGSGDNGGIGAAWVYTRSNGAWTKQAKLTGSNSIGSSIFQGLSVSLSADGKTAIVGGPNDNAGVGAFWVFTQTAGQWSQFGAKLTPSDSTGNANFGHAVALSGGGSAAVIGGPQDNGSAGAMWYFRLTSGAWTQQGSKLVGTGAINGFSQQGSSVAISLDGNTAISGAIGDNSNIGAAWVFAKPAATHFSVTAPATLAAGASFSTTVTALDVNNNTVADYSGTIHFTSTDAAAVLPADSTLTAGTGTFSVTFETSGSQTFTVTDTASASVKATSSPVTVNPGAAARLAVTAPPTAPPGVPITFTVTAQDQFKNTATAYAGTVKITSTDASATLPANAPLTNGTGTFSITLSTLGNQSITATDTVTASITGNSSTVQVKILPATHFSVTAPSTATAGAAISVTVTAQDSSNNTVPTYSGTVHFTSTDSAAALPADATLTNGVGTFSVTLKTSGNQTVTATDTATSSITGATPTIAVGGAAATHFKVTGPANATAGTAFNATVTALDAFNNTSTAYAGTVHITTSDSAAVLPANSTLTTGAGTFSVTLQTAGSQTITATDTVNAAITGTTASGTTVAAAAASKLKVTPPATATAGTAVSVTITAQDAFGNNVSSYTGTVHFTSTDNSAVLPANAALASGTATVSVTFKTTGSQTVTATDITASSITGTSASVTVAAGTATGFKFTVPSTATAGTVNFTVTAIDAFNNTATGYAGTVHFTSSDTKATLPADTTLTNGTANLSATLATVGNQTITATDTATASITGTSGAVAITGGAPAHFTVAAPSTVAVNGAFNFTVTAVDAFNNPATGYTGTVHFSSSDSSAILPANATLTNGTATFSATLVTVGPQLLGATDTVNLAISGISAVIQVSLNPATHFSVTAPATATAGTAVSFTITALDASNATSSGYSGTVHFTSTDAAATLPANAVISNGTGTFSATLGTAGNQTITATDTLTASITGTSAAIAVSPGAVTHLALAAPTTAAVGTAVAFTVTGRDAFNNVATAYTGTVHITSTDSAAVLPANTALVKGSATLSATFQTVGSQTLTATDTVTAALTVTSPAIAVGAGAATKLKVTAPASANAGSAISFTVSATDALGNPVASYAGTVHFTSTDAGAILPANATLVSGTGTFSASFQTAGNQTITATDTTTASINGTSAGTAVAPAVATHLKVIAPAVASPGVGFNLTVTAQDAFNNTATGYTGTVHFTSTDAAATLPANATLTSGTATFPAALGTIGSQAITATDTGNASITGTSATIVVINPVPTHFVVAAPSTAVPGAAFNFTVTALDSGNNVITAYTGTVHFTSTDSAAVLPANATLTNGTATFSATLNTAGAQTITATDTTISSITGVSAPIVLSSIAPTPGIVAPGAGSGLSPTMTFTFNDPRGWQDLDVVNVLVNNFLDGRQACYLAYSRTAGVLYLVDDAGGSLLPGLILNGSANNVSNSQCTISGANSFAAGSGTTLTLTLNITFTAAFAGNKIMYLAARDLEGGNSGWQALGTWGVPGLTFTGPSPTGVIPARTTESGGTFTFTFTDPKGVADMGVLNILINNALDGRQACYLAYSRPLNTLYLVNDTGTGLLPGITLNTAGTLSNSQCIVSASATSVNASGNNLSLTLTLTFPAAFNGNRIIYTAARDTNDANNSGWQSLGSLTIQ